MKAFNNNTLVKTLISHLNNAKLYQALSQSQAPISKINFDFKNELLTIKFAKATKPKTTLKINFKDFDKLDSIIQSYHHEQANNFDQIELQPIIEQFVFELSLTKLSAKATSIASVSFVNEDQSWNGPQVTYQDHVHQINVVPNNTLLIVDNLDLVPHDQQYNQYYYFDNNHRLWKIDYVNQLPALTIDFSFFDRLIDDIKMLSLPWSSISFINPTTVEIDLVLNAGAPDQYQPFTITIDPSNYLKQIIFLKLINQYHDNFVNNDPTELIFEHHLDQNQIDFINAIATEAKTVPYDTQQLGDVKDQVKTYYLTCMRFSHYLKSTTPTLDFYFNGHRWNYRSSLNFNNLKDNQFNQNLINGLPQWAVSQNDPLVESISANLIFVKPQLTKLLTKATHTYYYQPQHKDQLCYQNAIGQLVPLDFVHAKTLTIIPAGAKSRQTTNLKGVK